ncbi:MAG: hypothetical protein ACTSWR_06070, partial [Candidatus Helarchaeota archaeon]
MEFWQIFSNLYLTVFSVIITIIAIIITIYAHFKDSTESKLKLFLKTVTVAIMTFFVTSILTGYLALPLYHKIVEEKS